MKVTITIERQGGGDDSTRKFVSERPDVWDETLASVAGRDPKALCTGIRTKALFERIGVLFNYDVKARKL